MRRSYHSLALTLAFAAAACGFEAPPPQRTPPPATPALPVSEIAATLVVPAAAIVDVLNAKTKGQLATIKDEPVNCTIAKCNLDLVATRTGPITGNAGGGRLSLNVPMAATAQLEMKAGFFKTKADSQATGAVHTDTAIVLANDWHVQTDTRGTVDLSQAELRVGPLKMSFADLWNRNQEQLSGQLFKALDRNVASGIKIRPQAERLWQKVQQPIRVGKSPSAWLVLEPERVRVSQPATHNNTMIVSLGVDVRAHVVVGDAPPQSRPGRALPAPAPLAAPSNHFAVVVPVLLPYDAAANLAMQRLEKTPLKLSGQRVRFEKLEILPSGQDVVVAARFCVSQSWDPLGWLDSCGDGYLRGVPQFDAKTNSIRVANMHYDIATEGMILSIMRFLAGDELSKAIERDLVFNLGHDIEKVDQELKAALAKPQGRGVIVTADVQNFGQPSLTWTKDGFLATFPAAGTIHADLNLKDGVALDSR